MSFRDFGQSDDHHFRSWSSSLFFFSFFAITIIICANERISRDYYHHMSWASKLLRSPSVPLLPSILKIVYTIFRGNRTSGRRTVTDVGASNIVYTSRWNEMKYFFSSLFWYLLLSEQSTVVISSLPASTSLQRSIHSSGLHTFFLHGYRSKSSPHHRTVTTVREEVASWTVSILMDEEAKRDIANRWSHEWLLSIGS
jgi:hypothetical protein